MKVYNKYRLKVDYRNDDDDDDAKCMKLLIYSDEYEKTPEGYEQPHDPFIHFEYERWCMDDDESTRELAFVLMQHNKNPQGILQFMWDNPDVEILLG